MSSEKKYRDKDWLKEQYVDKERSTTDIGEECNVAAWTINTWLKKFGVEIRDANCDLYQGRREFHRKYDITEEYLRENYLKRKKTLNRIAREFGCSWDTVRKRIRAYGLPMRNKNQKNRAGRKRTTTEYRRFQKKCLREYGYECVICGYDKFVNAHHIEPWAKNHDNSVENGIVLCPNHHAEADYGIISEEELREYQQETVRTA